MALNEQKLIEALAAEVERAIAAGERDRAQKLADLLGSVTARIGRQIIAYARAESVGVPAPRPVPLQERAD
jgi:hypothetical protein